MPGAFGVNGWALVAPFAAALTELTIESGKANPPGAADAVGAPVGTVAGIPKLDGFALADADGAELGRAAPGSE